MAERNGGRDETIALILSGGVGLGAYQAGAYAAFHEGGLRPDWLAGSSIGAVNAAIIAGNPAERRIEPLQQFWETAATESTAAGAWAWAAPSNGPWRHAYNWMNTLQTRTFGTAGLFQPRFDPAATAKRSPSLYDMAPLQARLKEFVDFDRLNGGDVRVAVIVTDVATGEEVTFDTERGDRIEVDHLLATCGFLPEFAAVEIGGRLLGDGGFVANAPIDAVLSSEEARANDLLCFVVDLFARDGSRPASLEAAAARRGELLFSSQSQLSLEAQRRERKLRAMIGRLRERAPPELRDDPEIALILAEGSQREATVLYLSYRAPADEAGPEKQFDFSRATLSERWQAGVLDMSEALRTVSARPSARDGGTPGLTIHKIRR